MRIPESVFDKVVAADRLRTELETERVEGKRRLLDEHKLRTLAELERDQLLAAIDAWKAGTDRVTQEAEWGDDFEAETEKVNSDFIALADQIRTNEREQ